MNKKKKITLAVAVLLVLCLAIGSTLAYLATVSNQVQNTFTFGNIRLTLDEKDLTEGAAADARTNTGNVYNLVMGEDYDKDPTVTVRKGSEECYVRMLVKVDLKGLGTDELKPLLLGYLADLKTNNPTKLQNIVTALATKGWVEQNAEGNYDVKLAKIAEDCLLNTWSEATWPREGAWYGKNADNTKNDMVGIAEYRYKETVNAMDAAQTLDPLFSKFHVPETSDFEGLSYELLDIANEILDYINQHSNPQTEYTINDLIPTITIIAQAVTAKDFVDDADAAFEAAGYPAGFEAGELVGAPSIPANPTVPTP